MSSWNELKIETLTHVVMGLGKVLSGMSDTAMLKLMRAARPLVRDAAMRAGFDELIDVFAAGPPNSTLLRRMVNESRYEELRDFLYGALCFKEMDAEDLH